MGLLNRLSREPLSPARRGLLQRAIAVRNRAKAAGPALDGQDSKKKPASR